MIDLELLRRALSRGISGSSLIAIYTRNMNIPDWKELNNLDVITELQFSGFIDLNFKLTIKGEKLLADLGVEKIKSSPSFDFKSLHEKLQATLLVSQGKKQIQGFGGVYFIPTVKELEEFLKRFWKQYPEYKEYDKISKILCNHINKCCKSGKFAPAIKYFVYKQGTGSQLGACWDSFEEIDVKLDNSVNI